METFKQFYTEGLWDNINAKKERGGKSAKKGSKAYKAAKKAGDKLHATKESIRRATPDPRRTRIGDDLKQQLLDHGMNMYQQHGSDIRGVVMTLGALVARHDEYSDTAKRVIHDYLGGEFVQDLEDKLDDHDRNEWEDEDFRGEYDEQLDETSARCTKTTKKASSTSKGKKYMKCVKSDSGGYKRIHWGQKGAKVTGKSGNTKRKKSFRARHKCSTAKANTPRGAACADW